MFDRYTIETPENISFGYDVAGIGSRFLATLIDTLIQFTLILFLVVAILFAGIGGAFANVSPGVANWLPVIFIIGVFLIEFGYYIAFEIFTGGQSPGKLVVGLRVIKENGYPLSVLDSIIRNLIRVVDFLPFGYGVGIIVMFLNSRSKRLGDFAAGTLVVKVREQVKLSELQAALKPAATDAPTAAPALPDVRQLREADIELIESFLRRRSQLRNADALAATLAKRIRARLDAHEAANHAALSDLAFLEQTVAGYRRARGA